MKPEWSDLWFPPINLWNCPNIDYTKSLLSPTQLAYIAEWKFIKRKQHVLGTLDIPAFLKARTILNERE